MQKNNKKIIILEEYVGVLNWFVSICLEGKDKFLNYIISSFPLQY